MLLTIQNHFIVFILLITPVAHINTGGKHTIYFFNKMVLDGLQHNFSFLFFYNNFTIGLNNGIIAFFTHFKICRDGKIDFFFKLKNAIARYIKRPAYVCVRLEKMQFRFSMSKTD